MKKAKPRSLHFTVILFVLVSPSNLTEAGAGTGTGSGSGSAGGGGGGWNTERWEHKHTTTHERMLEEKSADYTR